MSGLDRMTVWAVAAYGCAIGVGVGLVAGGLPWWFPLASGAAAAVGAWAGVSDGT